MERARRFRWTVLAALALGWLVMLGFLWSAFWTLPSPELLRQQRMVQPPTLGSLAWVATRSALELAAFAVVLWPRWVRLYGLRLVAAGVGALAWFVFTVPLGITSIQRVHRIWLAGSGAGLVVLGIAVLLWTGIGRLRSGDKV